jgi:hypothetical protein
MWNDKDPKPGITLDRLLYDFAFTRQAAQFPTHGWARNSQGVKILWCPLRRALVCPGKSLLQKGTARSSSPTHDVALPFGQTLQKLVATLRELHFLVRVASDHACDCDLEPELCELDRQAFEMIPLYFDLAITYLRRIPDLLVMASRSLLFRDWQSTPCEFKKWSADIDSIEGQHPICDFRILRESIVAHSGWFNQLRDKSPVSGKRGVRDAMEHRAVQMIVTKRQVGDERPRFTLMLESLAGDVDVRKDILPVVSESVAGLCGLMTGFHGAIGIHSAYEWGDSLATAGNDDDVVGFWPEIATRQTAIQQTIEDKPVGP